MPFLPKKQFKPEENSKSACAIFLKLTIDNRERIMKKTFFTPCKRTQTFSFYRPLFLKKYRPPPYRQPKLAKNQADFFIY